MITLAWALLVLFSVLELGMLNRLIAGEEVSDAEYYASGDRLSAAGIFGWVARFAGAAVFIAWMHRAYRNLDVLDPGARRFDQGWAIGAWFVPVLMWWRPKQIINDIWRGGEGSRGFAIGTVLVGAVAARDADLLLQAPRLHEQPGRRDGPRRGGGSARRRTSAR